MFKMCVNFHWSEVRELVGIMLLIKQNCNCYNDSLGGSDATYFPVSPPKGMGSQWKANLLC